MKLLGARKFIDLPAGTLYVEYWLDNEEQCQEMIEEFRIYPEKFLDTGDLMIYCNNDYSLCMNDVIMHEKELIFTDINVVGDADPKTTLRIVFDISELPDVILVRGLNWNEKITWTKKELKKIIKEVIDSEDYRDHSRAHLQLKKLYDEGNKIIDIDI